MSRRPLAVALVALCLVVAGCGDDDDNAADEAVEPNATATVVEDDAGDAGDSDDAETTTTSTVPDAVAEEPPGGSGGEDEGLADEQVYVADLSGDGGGEGRAEIEATADGRFCFDMAADGLSSEVTDAHIHEGTEGATGGVVVAIGVPTSREGETHTWTDVCTDVEDALRDRISADPSSFYVNVHTAGSPQGEIRGQLRSATIFDLTLS